MVYSASQDGVKFLDNKNRKFVSVIIRVVKILEKFTNNYGKRLNFTKLARYLNLNTSEMDDIIGIILQFQELFINTFDNFLKVLDEKIKELKKKPLEKYTYYLPTRIKCQLTGDELEGLKKLVLVLLIF